MTRAAHVEELTTVRSNSYPEPFRSRMGDRSKRRLGDGFGLTQFGTNLVELAPGGQSALRHWHTLEDELVYVLEGELVLVTDDGEQQVGPGSVVGFKAGLAEAHHFVNRSTSPARYLEVGSRIEADVAHYPDDDLAWVNVDGTWRASRKDGSLYEYPTQSV